MVTIQRIEPGSLEFPSTEEALSYPNGLLAVGGDLSMERLLRAYRAGIFPWFEDPQPILWWSPDPRSVLYPQEMYISRSLRRSFKRNQFRITADRAFHRVVAGCAAPRASQRGTWITNAMGRAYMALHQAGHAHSVEVWDRSNRLVGGLYGVAQGKVFFGESMFSDASDASKTALVALRVLLGEHKLELIDCQVESEHLNSMGARNIPRLDFEQYLAQTRETVPSSGPWLLEIDAGELL